MIINNEKGICISCKENPHHGCPLRLCYECLSCDVCTYPLKDVDCVPEDVNYIPEIGYANGNEDGRI